MKTREMLELAALAVGYRHVDYSSCDYDGALGIVLLDENGGQGKNWNPADDDGDSRRLEVALNMDVLRDPASASQPYIEAIANQSALPADTPQPFAVEPYDTDPLAATRMAVLRCAAEIGKSMKEKSK